MITPFFIYKKNTILVLTQYQKGSKLMLGGREMRDIFLNISEESDLFKQEFKKDFISLAELIDECYELIHERNELKYKIYQKENPDTEHLFEIENSYDRANGN